jgi:hypothetical protein
MERHKAKGHAPKRHGLMQGVADVIKNGDGRQLQLVTARE